MPPQHAEDLVAHWGGPVETLHLDDANHVNVTNAPATLAHIAAYISEVGAAEAGGAEIGRVGD